MVLLNPAISIQTVIGQHFWSLGVAGNSEDIAPLTVYDLKHPDLAQLQFNNYLLRMGFNATDFQQILNQDSFATGAGTIDPNRFLRTSKTILYWPPDNICVGPCTCLIVSETIKNDTQTEVSQSFQAQYTLDYNVITVARYTGSSLGFTDDNSATMTNSVTITHSHGNTDSASYTVNCPSVNYNGDTELQVYWDTL